MALFVDGKRIVSGMWKGLLKEINYYGLMLLNTFLPLWSKLLHDELEQRGMDLYNVQSSVQSLVTNDGRMCRQYFSAFEKVHVKVARYTQE